MLESFSMKNINLEIKKVSTLHNSLNQTNTGNCQDDKIIFFMFTMSSKF